MNLSCIKYLIFTKDKEIKTKRKIDGKISFNFHCIDYGFKMFATNDEKELSDLIKVLI